MLALETAKDLKWIFEEHPYFGFFKVDTVYVNNLLSVIKIRIQQSYTYIYIYMNKLIHFLFSSKMYLFFNETYYDRLCVSVFPKAILRIVQYVIDS